MYVFQYHMFMTLLLCCCFNMLYQSKEAYISYVLSRGNAEVVS